VGAAPPEEFVFDEYALLFPDTNINRSVFVNITARDFCNWEAEAAPFFEWLDALFLYEEFGEDYQAFLDAGGDPDEFPIQPPPVDPGPPPSDGPPPFPALEPVNGIGVSTGQGAVVGRIDAKDLYIEMWEFDEDPSPLIGPCEDIQQQLDAGDDPWATGFADVKAKTNDFDFSGTRGVAFGDRTTAVVTDQDGNEYSYRNVFRLNGQCNAPEFAPPACLVDNSKLRAK
jgi:hypothetical protein